MEGPMTKDQVKAVLERVPTWPEDRQQELAELALEIEAELAGAEYEAAPDELVKTASYMLPERLSSAVRIVRVVELAPV